jgi:hypothetical protein
MQSKQEWFNSAAIKNQADSTTLFIEETPGMASFITHATTEQASLNTTANSSSKFEKLKILRMQKVNKTKLNLNAHINIVKMLVKKNTEIFSKFECPNGFFFVKYFLN